MSCDYAILSTQGRPGAAEADRLLCALWDGAVSAVLPNAAIDALYAELTSLHPEIDKMPSGGIENSPWSASIDRSPGHLFMCCVWSKADYVKDLLLSLGKKYDLAVYDPQVQEVYYPDIFYPDLLCLTAEDERAKKSPELTDVQAVLSRMDMNQGPNYLVLMGRGLDYAQCFGWRGAFTVEWREHNGINFRHWKAGLRGQVTNGEAFVEGREYSEQVQSGERLSNTDVLAILEAYLRGQHRPDQFDWRDISGQFNSPSASES